MYLAVSAIETVRTGFADLHLRVNQGLPKVLTSLPDGNSVSREVPAGLWLIDSWLFLWLGAEHPSFA